jgi:hypothetical protein
VWRSYFLKLAKFSLKWENLLDSSPFLSVGWELNIKKFPYRELLQFRQGVYQNFNKRADTLMDLLDALSSNTSAQTVVELSLNSAFRRDYSALFTALDEWEPEKAGKTLTQLAAPYLPKPKQFPFWLLGLDVTPQPRVHAPTLEDRSYVYQPNPIKSNKPITIGHAYSSVVLFPEEEGEHGPVWVAPLDVKRVKSSEDKEMVGALQTQVLMEDKKLPFHDEFCVEVVDSGYSKPAFLEKNSLKTNLVTIAPAPSIATACDRDRGRASSVVGCSVLATRRGHLACARGYCNHQHGQPEWEKVSSGDRSLE